MTDIHEWPDARLEPGAAIGGGESGDAVFVVLKVGQAHELPTSGGRPTRSMRRRACSTFVKSGSAHGAVEIRPGARFIDRLSGLLIVCIEGGAGLPACSGRPMVRLTAPNSACG